MPLAIIHGFALKPAHDLPESLVFGQRPDPVAYTGPPSIERKTPGSAA
jgi:hypothetical protein